MSQVTEYKKRRKRYLGKKMQHYFATVIAGLLGTYFLYIGFEMLNLIVRFRTISLLSAVFLVLAFSLGFVFWMYREVKSNTRKARELVFVSPLKSAVDLAPGEALLRGSQASETRGQYELLRHAQSTTEESSGELLRATVGDESTED